LQNNLDLAMENLQLAINFNIEYKTMAQIDKDFDAIREDVRFQQLIQSNTRT
jgi:hypothetical protein